MPKVQAQQWLVKGRENKPSRRVKALPLPSLQPGLICYYYFIYPDAQNCSTATLYLYNCICVYCYPYLYPLLETRDNNPCRDPPQSEHCSMWSTHYPMHRNILIKITPSLKQFSLGKWQPTSQAVLKLYIASLMLLTTYTDFIIHTRSF